MNGGIAQHPDIVNRSRGNMEGVSRGYSLRLTTIDMQLKRPLGNNGVVVSRVFVVRQRNSRGKIAGCYEHLLGVVSGQSRPQNRCRFDTGYLHLSVGMDRRAQQSDAKYDKSQ